MQNIDFMEITIPEGLKKTDEDNEYQNIRVHYRDVQSFEEIYSFEEEYEPKTVLNMARIICRNNKVGAVKRLEQIPNFCISYMPEETESVYWIRDFAAEYHFNIYDEGVLNMDRYMPLGVVSLNPYSDLIEFKSNMQEIEDRANSVGLNSHRGVILFHLKGYTEVDISMGNKVLIYALEQVLGRNYDCVRAVFAVPAEAAELLASFVRKETDIMTIRMKADIYPAASSLGKGLIERMASRGLLKALSGFKGNSTVDQKGLNEIIPVELRDPDSLDGICNELYLNYEWGGDISTNFENLYKAAQTVRQRKKTENKRKIGFIS